MATIKEIAEMAGVSRGTVDRVLNNRGSVNADTANKVKEIAIKLGYKPNKAAIILSAQKKNLKIGVILFGANNPFFDDVIDGINRKQEELEGYNCTILIKRISTSVDEQLNAINDFVNEGISGIALTPYNDKKISSKINKLSDMGIPVVTLNTDINDSKRIAYVGSNYYLSGKTAAGLMSLMTSGDVYVGVVSGLENVLCHSQRIEGFKDCIDKDYPNIKIVDTIYNNDDDVESYELTSKLLEKHPYINALFFVAGGVYGGCKATLALDRDGSITSIAFDDVPTTKNMLEKGIVKSIICQQPGVQGEKPIDILFNYLTTGELPKEEYNYVSVDIRIRENI